MRLHRRARRLARGAVAALILLFVASEEAQLEAERALAAEELAGGRLAEAKEQRAEADRQRQVAEDNLFGRLNDLFGELIDRLDLGEDVGVALVASEALGAFSLGEEAALAEDQPLDAFLDDPWTFPPFERGYPAGSFEGPEASYDYFDGFASLTSDQALADLEFGVGSRCRG